jgi:hypothetical protein
MNFRVTFDACGWRRGDFRPHALADPSQVHIHLGGLFKEAQIEELRARKAERAMPKPEPIPDYVGF